MAGAGPENQRATRPVHSLASRAGAQGDLLMKSGDSCVTDVVTA